MADLLLYDHPLSPYAQKVKIALLEKSVAFDTRIPSGIGVGGAQGEFAEANPRLEVPALIDGETQLFDSTIILEYVEDKWPEPALLPADPAGRAEARAIEDVLDTHFEAIVWGLGEIHFFKRATGDQAEAMEKKAAAQIAGFHGWLEKRLADNDWFGGERFGWGDLSAAPYVNGAAGFGFAPKEGSRLAEWLKRANGRPSVARVTEDARNARAAMAQVAEAVGAGQFKREYRDHRLEWMIRSGGLGIVQAGIENDSIRFTPDFS